MSDEADAPQTSEAASRAAQSAEARAQAADSSPSPGAPVEESEASPTEVLEAVERATGSDLEAAAQKSDPAAGAAKGGAAKRADAKRGAEKPGKAAASSATGKAGAAAEREQAAQPTAVLATEQIRGEQIAGEQAAAEQAAAETAVLSSAADASAEATPGPKRKGAKIVVAEPVVEELPSLEEELARDAGGDPQARDGEIRISPDHPMAALYTQTPQPPEPRRNRGAGVLIALVATVGFAVVNAGALAAWLAPQYPPSGFFDALLPWLLSWGFIASAVAFFAALAALVLVVGRAGWWAYVLGGFLVGAVVWAAATLGYAVYAHELARGTENERLFVWDAATLIREHGLTVPVLAATVVAREATIWFGAWIGFRGRRMKLRGAEEAAEYEAALAEAQANRP